jgi:hypothetical protein
MSEPLTYDDLQFFLWLLREGFRHAKPIGQRRWAAIQPMAFTHRLSIGQIGDRTSIDDGWCYHNFADAYAALAAWDGEGEPAGWHRHLRTGRRVSQSPDERDANGQLVGAVGVVYVRP